MMCNSLAAEELFRTRHLLEIGASAAAGCSKLAGRCANISSAGGRHKFSGKKQ